MTHISRPSHNNPYPGCHMSLNYGSPFHGNHFYILSLSYLYPGVENWSLKEILIMHFYYMTYIYVLSQEPLPRGQEIYNFYVLGISTLV